MGVPIDCFWPRLWSNFHKCNFAWKDTQSFGRFGMQRSHSLSVCVVFFSSRFQAKGRVSETHVLLRRRENRLWKVCKCCKLLRIKDLIAPSAHTEENCQCQSGQQLCLFHNSRLWWDAMCFFQNAMGGVHFAFPFRRADQTEWSQICEDPDTSLVTGMPKWLSVPQVFVQTFTCVSWNAYEKNNRLEKSNGY